MNYYTKRIFNDKLKMAVAFIIFLIPFFEVLLYLRSLKYGATMLNPRFTTFLAGNTAGHGHMIQGVLLWFLPLYLIIIVAEDDIQDYKNGNKNILISRWGKKKYFYLNMKKSFIISFTVMIVTLITNFVITQILFHGGIHSPHNIVEANTFLKWSLKHPAVTNLGFIIMAAILAGIIGVTGSALSIAFHNRQIVYSITFLLWFIPCILKKSLMFSLQPFTEYGPKDMLPTLILFIIANMIAVIVSYIIEVKYAEI